MAFKIRRQGRKEKLSQAGFLPFEAQRLSALPSLKIPYVRQMISERKRLLRKAVRGNWTKKKYVETIKDMYEKNYWKVKVTAVTRRGMVGYHDPWAMLRKIRDDYIYDHPEFKSPGKPSKKRKKETKLDEGKIEKGRRKRETPLERYDRLRGR